ncbi:unnamed protein product [Cladocopium goreaui]|uniref:Protein-tyrosine-phosphatase n=1 Tax=Cladocopium goreaui TaxID=2562237 RepID=A0A9P1M0S1_9DINO|nr:unnamed protein product [Cladocopium goreaui]
MSALPKLLASFREILEDAKDWAQGSHEKSNWLIPGWVLLGGWPFRLPKGRGSAGESEDEGAAKLASILDAGILTFISLTEHDEIRGKAYCYNRFRSCAERHHALVSLPRRQAKRRGTELRFLECPMPDGGTCADEKVMQLLGNLIQELEDGRAVYIHCYGGHGRTGIVACALLCLFIEVAPEEAVSIFNHLHSYRVECGVGGPGQFPHSEQQFEQLCRIAKERGRFRSPLIGSPLAAT